MSARADPLGELARALLAGDERAAAECGERARAALVRFCRGYLGDAESAEDAAQDALARLTRSTSEPRSPRAALLAIARHRCLDVLRARAARPDAELLASDLEPSADTAGPITRLVGAERRSDLSRALAELSDDERELLRLRYADDLPRAEIGELVGIPEALVKSRLFEAVERLRRALRASPGG